MSMISSFVFTSSCFGCAREGRATGRRPAGGGGRARVPVVLGRHGFARVGDAANCSRGGGVHLSRRYIARVARHSRARRRLFGTAGTTRPPQGGARCEGPQRVLLLLRVCSSRCFKRWCWWWSDSPTQCCIPWLRFDPGAAGGGGEERGTKRELASASLPACAVMKDGIPSACRVFCACITIDANSVMMPLGLGEARRSARGVSRPFACPFFQPPPSKSALTRARALTRCYQSDSLTV